MTHTKQEIGAIIQTSVFCVDKLRSVFPGSVTFIETWYIGAQWDAWTVK